MKKALFSLMIGAAMLAANHAQAQDKPVLNTAPPGTPPPAATPPPVSTPTPETQPTPERPSGMDLPSTRDSRVAGGRSEISSKLFIYSNLGLNFGSYNGYSQFFFSLSPALGYRVTDRLALGPGITYSYSNYSFPGTTPSLSTSNVGVKVFGQFQVYDAFYLHAEYELTKAQLLAVDANGYLTGGTVSKLFETPLAGLAYRQEVSDRAAADIQLLYNFNSGFNSLYSNPVYRISFLYNLGR